MAITPADIEQLTFSPSKHGYDTDEVDSFLEQCAGEVDTMLQKIADLKGRLTSTESQLSAAQAQVVSLQQELASNGSSTTEPTIAPVPSAAAGAASEHQISQALIVAQQSADRIVAEAKESSDHIREEADQKAREVIRQALAEKQNELDEIDRLKQSREDFRTEYKGLLQHFMDDAESAFPNQILTSTPTGSTGTHHDVAPAASPYMAAPADTNAQAPSSVQPGEAFGTMDDLD